MKEWAGIVLSVAVGWCGTGSILVGMQTINTIGIIDIVLGVVLIGSFFIYRYSKE